MANRLGVPLAQVQHGKYGVAVCERAITPYETEAGSPLLHVAGNPATLGKTCLAIGLQVDKVEPSKNVFALCPAAEL